MMLATQGGDIATVGELRRLVEGLDADVPIQWQVELYDGPLTDRVTSAGSMAGHDLEILVIAPAAPVAPDAAWAAA